MHELDEKIDESPCLRRDGRTGIQRINPRFGNLPIRQNGNKLPALKSIGRDKVGQKRNAQARGRGLVEYERIVRSQPGCHGHTILRAVALKQPGHAALEMGEVQQAVTRQIFRCPKRRCLLKIGRRGDQPAIVRGQEARSQARICKTADPDRNVDPFFDDVDIGIGVSDIEADFGVPCEEFRQSSRQMEP